jgi:L-amino acid N-acyltransferase YncA
MPPRAGNRGRRATQLIVRLAVAADAAAIARIYNESLPPRPAGASPEAGGRAPVEQGMSPLTERQIQWWLEQHRQGGRPIWVAQVRNEVVGWLSLLGFYDRPGCGSAAEIAIYIGTAWHRRGIGRFLVRRALAEAPRWGLDRLMAFIWHDNEGSLGLFRSLGFMAWGALPGVVRVGAQGRNMMILGHELAAPVTATTRSN